MKKTLVALALTPVALAACCLAAPPPNFEAAAVSGPSRPAWGGTRRHSGVAKARRAAKRRKARR